MATRRNSDGDRSRRKKDDENLRAIYDKIRREFTAGDLQKYTVIEKGIPAEKVIAELEKIHKEETRKKRRKS